MCCICATGPSCVAVCCSVLQCVSVCCSVLQCVETPAVSGVALCCSVLQCSAVCAVDCSGLQWVAVCCSGLQCVLQCVAVCSSMFRMRSWSLSLSIVWVSLVCAYVQCVGVLSVYGVAMISRLLKHIGLFCRIHYLLWGSFAKETYHFKEPTHRSNPIGVLSVWMGSLCVGVFSVWV